MPRIVIALVLPLIAAARVSASDVDFVRDVQPIFEKHCHACHSGESAKGGLRLDVRSEAMRGGETYGAAIQPGQPHESPLVQFVSDENAEVVMPPKGPRLSRAEADTLARWVAQGADWPDGVDAVPREDPRAHWSFQPIRRAAPPVPRGAGWARGAIDCFVLGALEEAGLEPAPEIDRVAWLRRASFDLTGLPPTPEVAAAFSDDLGADAYEQALERLLAASDYGKRWAQHWLDVVRYADTHGFEVNTERPNAWPYRDYVIASLNQDKPYDQFIREQIAGDLVVEHAATGFLVTASVLLPGQIGKDDASKRLARQDALDEIVANITTTFLGLTVNCARCHNHKFDPVSQREYYEMQAFVAGVEYKERALDPADDTAMVFAGAFRQPDEVRVLRRGSPEMPKEQVVPAVPAVLGAVELPADCSEAERRQTLAEWIAHPANPLTARVMVNRLWQEHFGIGLVETPNDFGRNGAKPSHPQLLDWLAAEFIRSGWSLKQMHRLMMLSSAYRQSARFDARAAAIDSDNRLLWRYPLRRLSGEAIRDSILAVSGRLNPAMGGPGFDLFNKRGGLSGFRPVESFGADGLRRMIYAHRVRRERDAVFGAYDCPDYGQSVPTRRDSTTPVQALNLFNSRFVAEQAQALAERVQSEVGSEVDRQIERDYQLVLNRNPADDELADARAAVTEHGLAALCRALFNCNEFLFIP